MSPKYSILIAILFVSVGLLPTAAQTRVKFSGIGIQLVKQGNDPVVGRLIPGGSAQKAGIPVGAKIVSVDGKNVTGMSVEDVVKLISGQSGSVVSLGVIEKQSVSRTYSLVRMEMTLMTINDVPGTYVDPHNPAMAVLLERIADKQFKVSSPTQHWSGFGLVGSFSNSGSLKAAPSTVPLGSAPERHYIKGVYLMADHPDVMETLRNQCVYFRIDLDHDNHLTLRTRLNFANDSSTTPQSMMTEHILKKRD